MGIYRRAVDPANPVTQKPEDRLSLLQRTMHVILQGDIALDYHNDEQQKSPIDEDGLDLDPIDKNLDLRNPDDNIITEDIQREADKRNAENAMRIFGEIRHIQVDLGLELNGYTASVVSYILARGLSQDDIDEGLDEYYELVDSSFGLGSRKLSPRSIEILTLMGQHNLMRIAEESVHFHYQRDDQRLARYDQGYDLLSRYFSVRFPEAMEFCNFMKQNKYQFIDIMTEYFKRLANQS
jgi:hypothetical protein